MSQPFFSPMTGHPNVYVTVDGHIDWATLPAFTINGQKRDMPIRLRVGDDKFGLTHIILRHGKWFEKLRREPCELIWAKLSTGGGSFYKGNKKLKTNLYVRLAPECFLVLEYQLDNNKPFYSIVSLYHKSPKSGEESIGSYQSKFANPGARKPLRKI
jgi:hypothetical protein